MPIMILEHFLFIPFQTFPEAFHEVIKSMGITELTSKNKTFCNLQLEITVVLFVFLNVHSICII